MLGGNTATHATSPHSPSLPIIFSNDLCTVWQLSPDGQGPRICKLQMGSSYFFVSSGVKDIVDLKRHDVMGEQPTRTVRLSSKQRVSWMPFSLEGDQSVDNLLELEAFSIDPFNGGAPADAVYVMEIKSNFSREKRVEAAQFVSTLEEGLPPIASSNVGTSLLYSNSYLKVWDFIIAPGEICHLHRHTKNYFFLNLAKSTTQGLDQSGNLLGVPSVQKAGQVTFVDLKGGEAIHAVKNLGGAEFRQIIVELK